MAFTYLKFKSVKCLCLLPKVPVCGLDLSLGLVSSGLGLGLGLGLVIFILVLVFRIWSCLHH